VNLPGLLVGTAAAVATRQWELAAEEFLRRRGGPSVWARHKTGAHRVEGLLSHVLSRCGLPYHRRHDQACFGALSLEHLEQQAWP
jgi:hypothetical protein